VREASDRITQRVCIDGTVAVVTVRYDPASPGRVAFDFDVAANDAGPSRRMVETLSKIAGSLVAHLLSRRWEAVTS
jgi:hypothetical protein